MKTKSVVALLSILLLVPVFAGCGGEDAVGVATAETTDAVVLAKLPTADELVSRLSITDQQAATLLVALQDVRETMQARRAQGPPTGPPADGVHPLRDLLVTASDQLETAQFAEFTAMLVEWRDQTRAAHQEARGERRHEGPRGPRAEGQSQPRGPRGMGGAGDMLAAFLTEVLDLDADQQAALAEMHASLQSQMQEIRESGERPDFEAMRTIRDEALASFTALLSEDQAARFAALQQLIPGPGGHGRHARG